MRTSISIEGYRERSDSETISVCLSASREPRVASTRRSGIGLIVELEELAEHGEVGMPLSGGRQLARFGYRVVKELGDKPAREVIDGVALLRGHRCKMTLKLLD